MEDMMAEAIASHHIWVKTNKENIQRKVWVTQKGEELAITDMEDSHLNNCINMLNNKLETEERYFLGNDCGDIYEQYIHLMKDELLRREINQWTARC